MSVQLFHDSTEGFAAPVLIRAMTALLGLLRFEKATLELSLVDRRTIRRLNRRYLKKDRVTDVLSFPLDACPPGTGFPWHLGQIVIATPVARVQARESGRTLQQQLTRLAVHGLVHLTGRDHEAGVRARLDFEKLETRCLKYLQRKGLNAWDGGLQL